MCIRDRSRTAIINSTKKGNKYCFRKMLCCINRSFNSSSINIYILYNFNVFRKSKYKNITCNSFWIYIIRSSTNTVSYTHLDVYKRQTVNKLIDGTKIKNTAYINQNGEDKKVPEEPENTYVEPKEEQSISKMCIRDRIYMM